MDFIKVWYGIVHHSIVQCSVVQHSISQYSILQYITVCYYIIIYHIVYYYSVVQHIIVQDRILWYSLVQSSPVQYSNLPRYCFQSDQCTDQGTRRKLVPPRHGESWSWLSCICVGSNVSQTLLGSSHCKGFFKPFGFWDGSCGLFSGRLSDRPGP